MKIIVPDFLVEALAPGIAETMPDAITIGIDTLGRTTDDPSSAARTWLEPLSSPQRR